MTDDLVVFLLERLNEQHAALVRYRDGHDGPCRNYAGQPDDSYDEHDSCYLHIETAEATPYRDAAFGLADNTAKWDLIKALAGELAAGAGLTDSAGLRKWTVAYAVLRHLARPYDQHPDYRPEWAPAS